MNEIPEELLQQVLYYVDKLCKPENNYTYITFINANVAKYKLTIKLNDIDENNIARTMSITAKLEE